MADLVNVLIRANAALAAAGLRDDHELRRDIERQLAALSHAAGQEADDRLTVDVSKVSAEEACSLGRSDFCNFLRYLAEQDAGSLNTILNECSRRILTHTHPRTCPSGEG